MEMRGQLRLLDTLLCPMMTDGRTCVHKKSRLGLVQQIWLVGWQDHVRIHQPTLTQQIPSLRSCRTRWWMRWTTCHFADAFLMLYTMKTKTKLSSRVRTSNFWFAQTVTQKVSFVYYVRKASEASFNSELVQEELGWRCVFLGIDSPS